MQKGTIFNGMDLNAYLSQLQQNPKYTEEVLKLIEDDLRFGLTKEETEEYSSGKYDYGQMCSSKNQISSFFVIATSLSFLYNRKVGLN